MSAAALSTTSAPPLELNSQGELRKGLQAIAKHFQGYSDVDAVLLEVSQEICDLFGADRLTIYLANDDKTTITSKIKTGLASFRDFKLPLDEHSIAGFVGMTRKMLNLKDVYDEAELKCHHPKLRFLKEVDKRTGYRTKQMLVAPVLDGDVGLLGVVQLINANRGAVQRARRGRLAGAGRNACGPVAPAAEARGPQDEIRLPGRRRRTHGGAVRARRPLGAQARTDLESVLVDEFQVNLEAIGQALAKFFGVPYQPYKPDRIRPIDLLRNLKRDYVHEHQWVPLEEDPKGLLVMCLDPERVKASRVVSNVFPESEDQVLRHHEPRFPRHAESLLRRRDRTWRHRRPAGRLARRRRRRNVRRHRPPRATTSSSSS